MIYRWIQKEDEIIVYGLVTRYGPRTSYCRKRLNKNIRKATDKSKKKIKCFFFSIASYSLWNIPSFLWAVYFRLNVEAYFRTRKRIFLFVRYFFRSYRKRSEEKKSLFQIFILHLSILFFLSCLLNVGMLFVKCTGVNDANDQVILDEKKINRKERTEVFSFEASFLRKSPYWRFLYYAWIC